MYNIHEMTSVDVCVLPSIRQILLVVKQLLFPIDRSGKNCT